MTKINILDLNNCSLLHSIPGGMGVKFEHGAYPITSYPDEKAIIYSNPIPTGRPVDAVRLYAMSNYGGGLIFNTSANLDNFYNNTGTEINIKSDENVLITASGISSGGVNGIWYMPSGMTTRWNQVATTDGNEYKLAIVVPYFKIKNEVADTILEVWFDYDNSAHTAKFTVKADIATGSPNQNQLDFDLEFKQAPGNPTDSAVGYRKTPDYTGDYAQYLFVFETNVSTGNARVYIDSDYNGWTPVTLSVTPATIDTGTGIIGITGIEGNPDDTNLSTAISELALWNLPTVVATYSVSRDGGTNWASVNNGSFDSWVAVDNTIIGGAYRGYKDLDLSGQGNGDNELLVKVEFIWPMRLNGLGLAWGGD